MCHTESKNMCIMSVIAADHVGELVKLQQLSSHCCHKNRKHPSLSSYTFSFVSRLSVHPPPATLMHLSEKVHVIV